MGSAEGWRRATARRGMTKKTKTDKRVFDIRASKGDSTEPLVLAMSADATLLELHLAFLGALDWTGSYRSIEGAYRFDLAGERYEGGRGSRTPLRRLLTVGASFSYACEDAGVALQCECVQSYEVASRRHYPKVLAPGDELHTRILTWQAQSKARREYRDYEEKERSRTAHSQAAPSQAARSHGAAFLDGFFTAIVAGPMVMPMEFLGKFMGESFEDIDALNAAMGALMERYNEIATLLHERPDDFVERVVTLCSGDATGQALLDWYQGFVEAMALRDAEWLRFVRDARTGDLFKPFGMMADVRSTPAKRAWLADDSLRRNLANALGIVGVRTWEMFREAGPQAKRPTGRASGSRPRR